MSKVLLIFTFEYDEIYYYCIKYTNIKYWQSAIGKWWAQNIRWNLLIWECDPSMFNCLNDSNFGWFYVCSVCFINRSKHMTLSLIRWCWCCCWYITSSLPSFPSVFVNQNSSNNDNNKILVTFTQTHMQTDNEFAIHTKKATYYKKTIDHFEFNAKCIENGEWKQRAENSV